MELPKNWPDDKSKSLKIEVLRTLVFLNSNVQVNIWKSFDNLFFSFRKLFIFSIESKTFLYLITCLSSGEMRKTFHENIYLLSFCHMFSSKKHFIMYLLKNKNWLCNKIIWRKKQVAKHKLIVLNAFSERGKILWVLSTKNTLK